MIDFPEMLERSSRFEKISIEASRHRDEGKVIFSHIVILPALLNLAFQSFVLTITSDRTSQRMTRKLDRRYERR